MRAIGKTSLGQAALKQLWSLFLLCLAGCQAFTRPDTPATLRAENSGYVAEATAIAQTAQVASTRVHSTAIAASTVIARTDNINLQLLATARAIIPPTPQIASGELLSSTSGDRLEFVEFGTALGVRESDGCATSLQRTFSPEVRLIYVTARTFNMRAGTEMKVEWNYQGQRVHTESFFVPVDDADYCVWFNIDPARAAFSPGNWDVRLYAIRDGTQRWIDTAFTIEGTMSGGG